MLHTRPIFDFSGSLGSNPVFLRVASTQMAFLTARIEAALDATQEQLTELAMDAASDTERTQFMDAAVRLKADRDSLRDRFLGASGRLLREYAQLQDGASPAANEPRAIVREELRVLNDSDVAETLACEAAVQRAEQRFQADLHCLGLRLAKLAGIEKIDTALNPLGPQRLVEALREALAPLDCELAGRLEVIYLFDTTLLRQLETLYDPINKIMADAGILPQIRWEPRIRRASVDRADEAATESDSAATAETQAAGTAAPAAAQGKTAGDARGPERPAAPVRTPEQDAELGENEQALRRSYLDGWLYGSIQWLLSRRRSLAGDLRDATTAGIETGSLHEALDAMQTRIPDDAGLARRSIDHIKRDVMDYVAKSGRSQHSQLSLVDENILDSVGMMFAFMGRDSQLPEPFQAALGKLQIPYLKAALRDPEMLSDGQSPAKLLLNELAEAGQGWNTDSDMGGKLLSKVTGIVDRVLGDYRDDPGVFSQMLTEFRGFKQRQTRRAEVVAKRETEAMAGREKLQFARGEVGRFLLEQTRDVQLPTLVNELLRKSWSHVMVLTMLEHGRKSRQWEQTVAVARELIWSVTFDPNRDQVTRLKTRLPTLARALASGLKKVGYSDAEIRKLQLNLKQLYVGMMQRSGSDHVVIEASADGLIIRGEDLTAIAGDGDADADLELIEDPGELESVLNAVRGWRSGQWVMFHRGDEEPLRAKLSWVSPITGRYLFVNQRGMKVVERTAGQLAEELIGERVVPMNSEELVSRAMSAVAERLQADLSAAA